LRIPCGASVRQKSSEPGTGSSEQWGLDMQAFLAKYGAWCLAVLAIFGVGISAGWRLRNGQVRTAKTATIRVQARYDKAVADAELRLAETQKEAQASVAVAEAKAMAATAKVILQTKEVTRYVETSSPMLRDSVPWALVCAHDAAASGDDSPLAQSPCDAPGAPSAFTNADVARVVTANYGTCRDCQERLKAWQAWYLEMQSNWNRKATR